MIAKLITKFFGFILELIMSLVNIILTPLNLLVTSLIPDLSSYVTTINNFINTFIGNITYFLTMLGPLTKSALILEFNLMSIFFTIYMSYLVIHTSIYLITKIKSMFN